MAEKIEQIRALNDNFRKTFVGGRIILTNIVAALSEARLATLLRLIRDFDTFDEDNDPYHEHDFLTVEMAGEKYFAKIDYYEPDLTSGSRDPGDPLSTERVLTIMRADEY